MKLLILGAWNSCNLGDGVLCECMRRRLQQEFPQAQITLEDMILRDRSLQQTDPPVRYLEKRRILAGIRRIVTAWGPDKVYSYQLARLEQEKSRLQKLCGGDYDAVIFAGGQMFMDGYGLFVAYCTRSFAHRGIPVFFHACGMGSFESEKIREELRAALQLPNVRHISCRDSLERLEKELTPSVKVQSAWDCAITAAARLGVEADSDARTLGIGVMYPTKGSLRAAIKFWQKILRELESRGRKWQLFTNGDPADMTFARLVLDSVPEFKTREDALAPRATEPLALVKTIGAYERMISSRLHSHIIAASLGIPSVAVVWDDKLPAFFDRLGRGQCCIGRDTDPARTVELLLGLSKPVLPEDANDPEGALVAALKNTVAGI